MKDSTRKIETRTNPVRATYTTDCFRKVKQEDGTEKVVRWQQDHQVTPSLQLDREAGAVFHNGGRIA
jgi:hypothetical protein